MLWITRLVRTCNPLIICVVIFMKLMAWLFVMVCWLVMQLPRSILLRCNMKVKPKEVLLNLPVALLFDQPWEVANFAANINTILHGKVRLKAEELGSLGGKYVGLFYLQRNNESQEIHDEFIRLIEEEEMT